MATQRLPRPTRSEVGSTTAARTDRRTLALAAILVLAPVLRMISILIHPLDTADAAATLDLVDEASVRWAVAHLLEPYSTLLIGAAGFVLLRLTPGRGRGIATVGAALFGLGAAGLAMLVYAHGQAYLFMTHPSVDPADMTELYAQFHEGLPLAAPFIPMFTIGAALLAVGLVRGGRVHWGAALAFIVAPIVPNAIPQDDSLVLAAILGSAPMIAAMAVFARALVRQASTVTPAPEGALV